MSAVFGWAQLPAVDGWAQPSTLLWEGACSRDAMVERFASARTASTGGDRTWWVVVETAHRCTSSICRYG